MLNKAKILDFSKKKGLFFTRDLVREFGVSRQYVGVLISSLVTDGYLVKLGSTKKSFYVTPEYARRHPEIFPKFFKQVYKNKNLQEHQVFDQIEQEFSEFKKLPENVRSIFTYAFSEMFNNAIEHSKAVRIGVKVSVKDKTLSFIVTDSGIGVFRNIMQKRKLKSELESIQDLMKGKTTTMSGSHSGEGIFFTSKAGDWFMLDSFGYQMIIDNRIPDIFVKKTKLIKRGTRVVFRISFPSARHLTELFGRYSNITDDGTFGFDKTKIQVKLYMIGSVHVSRSQARRVLEGLNKFKVIEFDFDKVPLVGQAFADEIFRVFQKRYPQIVLQTINMNEEVKFMVERSINEAKKR